MGQYFCISASSLFVFKTLFVFTDYTFVFLLLIKTNQMESWGGLVRCGCVTADHSELAAADCDQDGFLRTCLQFNLQQAVCVLYLCPKSLDTSISVFVNEGSS
jgi:hypothetical protein